MVVEREPPAAGRNPFQHAFTRTLDPPSGGSFLALMYADTVPEREGQWARWLTEPTQGRGAVYQEFRRPAVGYADVGRQQGRLTG
jgi:hypothetical protein